MVPAIMPPVALRVDPTERRIAGHSLFDGAVMTPPSFNSSFVFCVMTNTSSACELSWIVCVAPSLYTVTLLNSTGDDVGVESFGAIVVVWDAMYVMPFVRARRCSDMDANFIMLEGDIGSFYEHLLLKMIYE